MSIDRRKVLANIFSLSALNAINYIFPIALLPYVASTLGPEKFGEHIFTLTILQWLSMIVGYGFDYSAARFVATNRGDPRKLSAVYSTVTCLKLFAFVALGGALYLALHLLGANYAQYLLLIGGFGLVFGTALTNNWLFQGLEETKYLTFIAFSSKLLLAALILVFITSEDSYIYINALHAIGAVFGGIVSMTIARKYFGIRWIAPDRAGVVEQIRDGWHLFLSTSFMSLYRETNVLILGMTTNFAAVGAYATAEKIIKALQSVIAPAVIALYPHFGRQLSSSADRSRALRLLFRLLKVYSLILSVATIMVIASSKLMIVSFLGEHYQDSILDVQIMSLVILFGGMNYCLGVLGLVNMNMQKTFFRCVLAAGVFSIALCVLLSYHYGDKGAAIAMVATEFTLLLLLVSQYKSAGLLNHE